MTAHFYTWLSRLYLIITTRRKGESIKVYNVFVYLLAIKKSIKFQIAEKRDPRLQLSNYTITVFEL